MAGAVQPASPTPPAGKEWGAGAAALDAALLAAHETGDKAALVRLYARAGDMAEAAGAIDACCFYLTQAYVFALAAGAPEAATLHARLLAYGREE